MWQYQTGPLGLEERWHLDLQKDYAATDHTPVVSPPVSPAAWKSASTGIARPIHESTSPGSQGSVGSLWTQPSDHRWQQFAGSPSPSQPSGTSRHWLGVSAAGPTSAFQPAPAAHTQYPLLEAQWQSSSSERLLRQSHRPHQEQQSAQLDGSLLNCFDLDTYQTEALVRQDLSRLQGQQGHKDNFDLQISQPRMENRVPDSAMRCLSGLVQPSLNESLNMPCSLLPAGTLATTTEQCLEAAALAAAAWPSGGLPLPAADEKVPTSFSSQASGFSDLCPEDPPAAIQDLPAPPLARSSPKIECGESEDDSAPEVPVSKGTGRKRTKIDHITVEFLQKRRCFDMPLADAAKSLDVGLSVMKRVCRNLGLARWPYRTRSSLRAVIEKTERYLADPKQHNQESSAGPGQKAHVIEALESHMNAVTGLGGADLNESIKKYRQSIFKLNYKLKKSKLNHKARHRIAVPRNAAERVLADQDHESNY